MSGSPKKLGRPRRDPEIVSTILKLHTQGYKPKEIQEKTKEKRLASIYEVIRMAELSKTLPSPTNEDAA